MRFDPETEAVAHFIGYFQLRVEEARLRDQYTEFRDLVDKQHLLPELQYFDVRLIAPYFFKDFDPGVVFTSYPELQFTVQMEDISVPFFGTWSGPGPELPLGGWLGIRELPAGYNFDLTAEYRLLPPGSIAVVVSQYTHLEDNDFITMVDRKVATKSFDEANDRLDLLISQADDLQQFKAADHPSDEAAIGVVIETLASQMASFEAAEAEGLTAVVLNGSETQGIHVNGEAVTVMPELEDYFDPDSDAEEVSETEAVSQAYGAGALIVEASTEFDAGSNVLINEALIGNSWTVSPVIAVQGDYIAINLISQINVWHDNDSLQAEFASWSEDGNEPTLAFNIASFTQQVASANADAANDATAIFPQSWTVTTITGNLIFLNWIEQINFVIDQDVAVLSNSGSSSYIEMGGNLSLNGLSLLGLGQYYDLILVGGQFYSANVILQKNILLDDDDLSFEAGASMGGSGSASTNGNLLWNQASITTTGAIDLEALPQDYATALQMLALGDESGIDALLGNAEFAGLSQLRVLYVEGNIFNLQYIEQTNVLGDADQVVIAAEQAQSTLQGEWSIATGANTLANIASITDAGPDSIVYVGGEIYSDSLLYQAELIATDDAASLSAGNDLASEAVVFLANGMLDSASQADDSVIYATDSQNGASADVMQTVTS